MTLTLENFGTFAVTAGPKPFTWAMLLIGFAGVGFVAPLG
jgi:hypothetical protein